MTCAGFWSDVTGWAVGPPRSGHPEWRSLEPASGDAYLHLQEVDAPPRVHIDLEAHQPGDTAARATQLGADLVGESDRWATLRSPGGLPFCVLAAGTHVHDAPQPQAWSEGHHSRLMQVCIDSPRSVHEREVAFWKQLLDEGDGPVRAHLDLGTDDVPGEVRRLIGLGAHDVAPGRGWHLLRDPAGSLFCVTGNSPAATRRRDLG